MTTILDQEPNCAARLWKPFRIIRANLRAYLVMNAIVYGLCLIGMGAGLLFPGLTAAHNTTMRQDGTADLVGWLLGNMWLFSLGILVVNILTVGLLRILLPSMIVPFAGIAIYAYWAFNTGVTLSPVNPAAAKTMIPHSLTALIEFQAYALLMLGSYLLGRSWLRPGSIGARNRRQGYARGLAQIGWLSLPALALFVIGAVYEAFEVIYLVPRLVAG
ncbi:stage II sporulation protein M [Sciscionella marina]|uniref:stage II sporulation protein M n=1 Tax=Sciscionella marina TaxID=508770 RepID=UPI00035F74AE|nr:stage II sporulation protein M [Sciscionella marina]